MKVPLSVLRGIRLPGQRWTEHDYSLHVALTLYEQSLCTGCGHPIHEAQDAAADPNSRGGGHHYEVPEPVRCHACTALAVKTQAYEKAEQSAALRFSAVRVEDVAAPVQAPVSPEHDQPDT